ncbi:MAG: RNA pseudouridine synthase [Treponema sp.]|nr:RNA pseudouridine synthase [Treponema sp.]
MAESECFLVVYKPPRMHSAPLKGGAGDTLLDWCAGTYPEVSGVRGKLEREGGLLHRLDYETRGLVLVARTQEAFEALEEQQKQGNFVKEYGALTSSIFRTPLTGFPPMESPDIASRRVPFTVESAFRPYGPGRKAVRPALSKELAKKPGGETARDRGNPYKTEIVELNSPVSAASLTYLGIRIIRGFRHQIRCHLAWLGHPILNDVLYGGIGELGDTDHYLELKSQGLSFKDPLSGETRCYRIPPIHEELGPLGFHGSL